MTLQFRIRAGWTLALVAGLVPPAAWAESLFVNDATVHTMALQPVLQHADILAREGRIVAVGHDLTPPADATVIEAGGRPVTPALFAGMTALGLEEVSLELTSTDQSLVFDPVLQMDQLHPEFDVTPAFNPHSSAIPVTRIEGYGWAMLTAGRAGSIVGGLGRAVRLDGAYDSFLGPRALFIGLGAATSALSGRSRAAQFMLLEQAWEESAAEDPPLDGLLTPAGRRVLRDIANGRVVFDVERASDIVQVLAFASRHGLKAVISGGAEAWKVADRLAEAGVPVIIDPLSNLPANFDLLGARLDNAALLHKAGVTIAFTGESAPHNVRKLRQAAGVAVAYGLPYEAGLAALTVNPSRIFGLPDGHGTLTAGAPADLVLWTGDPLEVTSLARQVVIGGKAIPMVSRQTLLRDRYLPPDPDTPASE